MTTTNKPTNRMPDEDERARIAAKLTEMMRECVAEGMSPVALSGMILGVGVGMAQANGMPSETIVNEVRQLVGLGAPTN